MKDNWQMHQPNPEMVEKLRTESGYHPITAAVLINRNISTRRDAEQFLKASLNNLRSPFALQDIPNGGIKEDCLVVVVSKIFCDVKSS